MKEIGRGVLTWVREERVTDRYGTVFIMPEPDSEQKVVLSKECNGRYGKLVAVVTETRESNHIGDFDHGVFPKTPQICERIELGTGKLFFEDFSVGLKPNDSRKHLWLDIHALYRAHSQTVKLFFDQVK